jgi:hypothetical protein
MAILRAARGSHFVVQNSTILHGSHYEMLARTSLGIDRGHAKVRSFTFALKSQFDRLFAELKYRDGRLRISRFNSEMPVEAKRNTAIETSPTVYQIARPNSTLYLATFVRRTTVCLIAPC